MRGRSLLGSLGGCFGRHAVHADQRLDVGFPESCPAAPGAHRVPEVTAAHGFVGGADGVRLAGVDGRLLGLDLAPRCGGALFLGRLGELRVEPVEHGLVGGDGVIHAEVGIPRACRGGLLHGPAGGGLAGSAQPAHVALLGSDLPARRAGSAHGEGRHNQPLVQPGFRRLGNPGGGRRPEALLFPHQCEVGGWHRVHGVQVLHNLLCRLGDGVGGHVASDGSAVARGGSDARGQCLADGGVADAPGDGGGELAGYGEELALEVAGRRTLQALGDDRPASLGGGDDVPRPARKLGVDAGLADALAGSVGGQAHRAARHHHRDNRRHRASDIGRPVVPAVIVGVLALQAGLQVRGESGHGHAETTGCYVGSAFGESRVQPAQELAAGVGQRRQCRQVIAAPVARHAGLLTCLLFSEAHELVSLGGRKPLGRLERLVGPFRHAGRAGLCRGHVGENGIHKPRSGHLIGESAHAWLFDMGVARQIVVLYVVGMSTRHRRIVICWSVVFLLIFTVDCISSLRVKRPAPSLMGAVVDATFALPIGIIASWVVAAMFPEKDKTCPRCGHPRTGDFCAKCGGKLTTKAISKKSAASRA